MKILQARNVHDALPHALKLLEQEGIETPSRNGPVLQAPWPVTTVYSHPCERVLFHPERDDFAAWHPSGKQLVTVTRQGTFLRCTANIDCERFPGDLIGPVYFERPLTQTPLRYNADRLFVPEGPGLGVQLG
jgi:hypothetical protein